MRGKFVAVLIERARAFVVEPPPENGDGVRTLISK
jgi:hypothetical protein